MHVEENYLGSLPMQAFKKVKEMQIYTVLEWKQNVQMEKNRVK